MLIDIAAWTRLSCRSFAANAVRLQLHALAYNLGNFMRTLAMPKTAQPWSLTSLGDKLIKIGAKVVSHGRYVTFQMAEVAVPQHRNEMVRHWLFVSNHIAQMSCEIVEGRLSFQVLPRETSGSRRREAC